MPTRVALVAVIVAAALALQGAFLHAVVAAPLASAAGALSRPVPAPVATFDEEITVVASPAAPEPPPAS